MVLQASLTRQEIQGLVEEEFRRRGVQPRGAVRFVGHELDSAVCEVEVTPALTAEAMVGWLQAAPIAPLPPEPVAAEIYDPPPADPTPEAVVEQPKRKRRS